MKPRRWPRSWCAPAAAAVAGLVTASAIPAYAQTLIEPAEPDRRFVAAHLDGGALFRLEPAREATAFGRAGAGVGWFDGRRVRSLELELGWQSEGLWVGGLGAEYASVRTGLSAGVAALKPLDSRSVGLRVEGGFSFLHVQAQALSAPQATWQLGVFLRVPVGLIFALLTS